MHTLNPLRAVWFAIRNEPIVAWTGIVGIVLAIGCAALVIARGSSIVPPEGDLLKPLSFNLAIGIWVLTLAMLVPFAVVGEHARRRWRIAVMVAILYFYLAETLPTIYGYDPRFSRAPGNPFMHVISPLFGLDSILVIVLFAVFAGWFFRSPLEGDGAALRLAVRWASVAAFIGFGVGIWMVVIRGRIVGGAGSALWPHALGFHGLQAVPLVAWLTARAETGRRRPIHIAGVMWVAATVAAVVQTITGSAPLEPTPASVVMVLALLGWAVVAGRTWKGKRIG